jgi:hypothetical protein
MKYIKLFEYYTPGKIDREDQHTNLKVNREILSKIVRDSNLSDDIFSPQSLLGVAKFIKDGAPSEKYLNGVVNKLKANGVDTSKLD